MSGVAQLAWLVLEVSDLDAWTELATRILGLDITPGQGGLQLRADERLWRILLLPGPADDLAALGWEAADTGSFERIVSSLRAADVEVVEDSARARLRGVQRLARFDDPAGNRNELALGIPRASSRFRSPKIRGGYAMGDLGVGHVALDSRSREESEAFYGQHLGLRLSDRIVADLKVMTVDIAFLRANARHHSLALGGPLGRRAHHLMLQMNDLEDVGRTFDRAWRAGRVVTTLGCHSNDRMTGFYMSTPSGLQIEVGAGGVAVDEDAWHPITHDRIAVWGHQPLPAGATR